MSLSPQTRTKPLILPTEIANLQDLEAFIKFPGPYPVCRTKLKYKKLPVIAQSVIPVPEDELKQRNSSLDKANTPSSPKTPKPSEQPPSQTLSSPSPQGADHLTNNTSNKNPSTPQQKPKETPQ